MDQNQSLNYMLYLQCEAELDHVFFNLSSILNQLNITLIPIKLEDCKQLDRSKRYHAVMIRRKFSDAVKAIEWKKEFLDIAMLRGQIVLNDVSSFSELGIHSTLEKKNVYFYRQLPIETKQLAMDLIVDFYKDKNAVAEWPGGKRAKLFESDKAKLIKV